MHADANIGYSGTPLVKKLGITEGNRVLLVAAPPGYQQLVAPLPKGVQFEENPSQAVAIAHVFVTRKKDLQKHLAALRKNLNCEAPIWVSWPKKSAKVPSDITESTIRDVALPLGFVDVKVCAVTEVWSGLKLVVRKKFR
jgi:hypothetical protein